jgi:hypothetical protein
MSRGSDARRLVRKFASGVLATQSLKSPGYPYASALPFCTDQRGRVVVLISHLAEHTRNADLDPRSSFLVSPLTRDLQEQGSCEHDWKHRTCGRRRDRSPLSAFFPRGRTLSADRRVSVLSHRTDLASLYRRIRQHHTIAADGYLGPALSDREAEEAVIDHMNSEHAHNLLDYCRHAQGKTPASAQMIGIDCDGLDVRANG